jgi:sRNA-binding protein
MPSIFKPRGKLKQEIAACRAILADRFPHAIALKGWPKKPLKVGILADLVAACPDLDGHIIGRTLKDYTSGPTYLEAILATDVRVDLYGYQAGPITDSQRCNARGLLKAWRKLGYVAPTECRRAA